MIRHKAVYRGGSGEIVEKKSRFIANIRSTGMPGIIALHFL